MEKITEKVKKVFEQDPTGLGFSRNAEAAFDIIILAVDNLIENQNSQKPATESLGDKKAKALMIVIEKMVVCMEKIEAYPNQPQFRFLYQQIFKLFEKAKTIKRAKNEIEFQTAISDL